MPSCAGHLVNVQPCCAALPTSLYHRLPSASPTTLLLHHQHVVKTTQMSLKAALSPSAAADDLELTIRFSASLPDLHLSIPLSTQPNANTSTLKQLIRTHLPSELTSRRIRLIYSGKALTDDATLSASLKRPLSQIPSRTSTPRPDNATTSERLKGKTPVRDPPAAQRIYIHCSIGDVVLTPAELAEEANLGKPTSTSTTEQQYPDTARHDPLPPAALAPRGFDRLLTTGFTPAEVSALRMQFLAIQAHTHTPDNMPSPDAMRALEDQWLDNDDNNHLTGDDVGSGNATLVGNEESEGGALDDMIYGTAMGFFWPLGCLMWAGREEGMWSPRRQMAVVVGVVLNVGLGFVRFTG